MVDGTPYGDTAKGGKFDVYINDTLYASERTDFYSVDGSFAHGTKYSIKNIRANDGYTYAGSSDNNISGTFDEDKTVYLMFYKTYNVEYDANGGAGAPSAETFTCVSGYKVTTTVPIREGYNFLGWSTSAGATTATYVPGQNWSRYDTENITLYAVWIAVYEITFDGNGGFVNGNELLKQTAVDGTEISNFPTASKTHHKFIGWNTSSDGKGEYCENFIVTEKIVLYAIYQVENSCYLKKNGIYSRRVAYVRKNGVYRKAIKTGGI